jgi:hypothetical protein
MTFKPHPLRIQRKRTKGYKMPEGSIYVGRPTKWGNPFVVDQDGDSWIVRSFDSTVKIHGYPNESEARKACVRLYREYLHNDGTKPGQIRDAGGIALIQQAKEELRGKLLACFCPLHMECHADVLAEIANS